MALADEKGDGVRIEGHEGFPAEPLALEGDEAIGEIAARREGGQPGIGGGAVDGDIGGVEQGGDRGVDVPRGDGVDPAEDEGERAEAGERDGDGCRLAQRFLRGGGLLRVVAEGGADEDVGVDGDLRSVPAEPAAAVFRFGRGRLPMRRGDRAGGNCRCFAIRRWGRMVGVGPGCRCGLPRGYVGASGGEGGGAAPSAVRPTLAVAAPGYRPSVMIPGISRS